MQPATSEPQEEEHWEATNLKQNIIKETYKES